MESSGKIKFRIGKLILRICTLAFCAFFAPMSANAALLNLPLPANTYITLNGFDWAWGASCASKGASDCDTLDFAFQLTQGWRIAESADMALAPTALDFLFPGANVPFNGHDPVSGASFDFVNSAYTNAASAGACADAYFTLGDGVDAIGNPNGNTCGWGNGGGQNINTTGWFNQNGETDFFAEVLFIRPAGEAPAPATLALVGLGLAGLGFRRGKKA